MIDFSNLMNSTGNMQRGFQAPGGASAVSSIFNGPTAPQSLSSIFNSPSASSGLGSAPLNVMPALQSTQPGSNGLAQFVQMLQQAFGQGGGSPSPPPASPLASLMKRNPVGGLY